MSFTFDSDQLAALLADETQARMLLSFGSYYYCTGLSAMTYGGDTYMPKGMVFDLIEHGVQGISAAVEIEDVARVLASANYSSRLAGTSAAWILLLRSGSGGWEEIFEINWYIRYCQWHERLFKLNLFGNTGFKRRAGLSIMSRHCDLKFKGALCGYSGGTYATCDGTYTACTARGRTTQFRGFNYAPEAGQIFQIQGVSHAWVSPPGENPDPPWNPDPWGMNFGHLSEGLARPSGRVIPEGHPSGGTTPTTSGGTGRASGRQGY